MGKLAWTKTNAPALRRTSWLVYGEAGAGKTSLVKTLPAANDNRVAYLYADPGYAVLRSREFNMARLATGQDVTDAVAEIEGLVAKKLLDWVVVDGIDEIGELVVKTFLAGNGNDMRGAYGDMGKYMMAWLKRIRDVPCNVMFITHREEYQDNEKRMYYRPAFPGNMVTDSLVNWFDFVVAVRFREMADETGKTTNERWLQMQTSADTRYVVKERGDGKIAEWELPDVAAVLDKMYKEAA